VVEQLTAQMNQVLVDKRLLHCAERRPNVLWTGWLVERGWLLLIVHRTAPLLWWPVYRETWLSGVEERIDRWGTKKQAAMQRPNL
jgi:hypothetical protein